MLICRADRNAIDGFLASIRYEHPPGDWEVRVLRGDKMLTGGAMMDEVSAALQFPLYFGRNSNALLDCLSDLQWMPSTCVVLVVTQATLFLTNALDESQDVLLDNLISAAEQWRAGITWSFEGTEIRALHVVLQTEEPELVMERLRLVPEQQSAPVGRFDL